MIPLIITAAVWDEMGNILLCRRDLYILGLRGRGDLTDDKLKRYKEVIIKNT